MSVETIDRYMAELEAVKNYPKVRQEKDEALNQVAELEKDLGEARKRISHLEQLPSRFEGKTYAEAEKAFLQAEENEIHRRADQLFKSAKEKWEKEDRPRETFDAAIFELKGVIQTLSSESSTKYFTKEIIDAGIHNGITKILETEVKRRMDSEFLKRVEEESDEKSQIKLENLKSFEWPNFVATRISPIVQGMAERVDANVFVMLRGAWTFQCDKCGQSQSRGFSPSEIALLLNSALRIECSNPDCKDFLGKHYIRTDLIGVINSALNLSSSTPP